MKKTNLMPSIVLGSICIIVALLLSVVNMITGPIIKEAQDAAANKALLEVLPNGKNFTELTITSDYPAVVEAGYKADGGYVFKMKVAGYKPGLVIMCGIDEDGKIVGVKHIQSSETYGYETELNGVYVGKDADNLELILAAGATKNSNTSKAYYDAVNAALKAYVVANGGTVDNRTPEQILQDNCNAALGTTDLAFSVLFESWTEFGDAKIYVSESGTVVKIGENFVGYDANGAPVGEHSADALAAANAAYQTYASLEKVDVAGISGAKSVKSVYKNAKNEYMFLLSSKGFEWAKSPIVIELIIDSNGAIVSCVTVSHSESGGYGSICGEPEYYNQYVGKTEATYTEVPNIIATAEGVDPGLTGGATQTSKGYKTAIEHAFKVFEALNTQEGGND